LRTRHCGECNERQSRFKLRAERRGLGKAPFWRREGSVAVQRAGCERRKSPSLNIKVFRAVEDTVGQAGALSVVEDALDAG